MLWGHYLVEKKKYFLINKKLFFLTNNPIPSTIKIRVEVFMNIRLLVLLFLFSACSTIHFRSNNKVPVTFSGNPEHVKEVVIEGKRDFYFWGNSPESHVVYVDEEVQAAGYSGLSKLIVYEHKNPQDILLKFLTLGLYMPTGYTITGYTFEDATQVVAPPLNK
jgi:hypothetical protein